MNKLYTARLLMVISILLIIVFQVYWLGKVFNEGKNAFRKTTDLTFKETLYRLQAARFTGYTMIFKGLPGDNVFMSDVVDAVHKTRIYNKDSTKKFIISVNTNLESGVKNRRILINSKNETLAPLEKLFRENKSLNDTIPIKKIDSLYHNLLGREGITVKYRLLHSTFPGKDSMEGNYSTKKAAVGLIDPFFYRADFEDPSAYVFKKMAIQMLLSVLLIALITISFVFLYRNLVAQQKLTAIKNEFIANITHELKTPIATVSVAIEAMKNFNALQNPEQAREYLGIAAQELDRLSLLVDKVLRLSMFENRQLELKYSRFDFLELLHEVIKSMQLQFEKCNAAVNVEVTGEDFSIEADRMDITGVIYNLFDNAIKYRKGNPLIKVTASSSTNHIGLSIMDNGIGINPLYKDKIFEKFFRVPHGHLHDVKGYGLGLSYAAHIISQHRGTIEAKSDGKSGTTFTLKLPRTNAG